MCHEVPIARDKTVGPSTTLTFAGIELNSIRYEAGLPPDTNRKMRRNYPSIFETQKSTPAGSSIFDWAPKFCDDRDHA